MSLKKGDIVKRKIVTKSIAIPFPNSLVTEVLLTEVLLTEVLKDGFFEKTNELF